MGGSRINCTNLPGKEVLRALRPTLSSSEPPISRARRTLVPSWPRARLTWQIALRTGPIIRIIPRCTSRSTSAWLETQCPRTRCAVEAWYTTATGVGADGTFAGGLVEAERAFCHASGEMRLVSDGEIRNKQIRADMLKSRYIMWLFNWRCLKDNWLSNIWDHLK